MALLLLLRELREELGVVLSVVHFNHKLRGRFSDADERFVAQLAARFQVPFLVAREDILAKSKRERANVEEAARRARYAFFEQLIAQGQVDKIAVAHNADDQAETVLAHILRGTGLAGLGGIHPEFGSVFRPLLNLRRAELRAYLRGQRQTWREDATNRDTKRMRARIRLKLMPVLEKQFQPAVVEHLGQLADLAREDEAWLAASAQLRLRLSAKEEKGEWSILLRDLLGAKGESDESEPDEMRERHTSDAITKRVIRLLVKKVKPHSGQLSAIHVEAVLRLARELDTGKSVHLPGGVEVRRRRDCLCFRAMTPKNGKRLVAPEFSHTVELGAAPAELRLLEQSCCLRFTVIDWPPQGRETNGTGAVLDREGFGVPLMVRNWRPGDCMQTRWPSEAPQIVATVERVGRQPLGKSHVGRCWLAARKVAWTSRIAGVCGICGGRFDAEGGRDNRGSDFVTWQK